LTQIIPTILIVLMKPV